MMDLDITRKGEVVKTVKVPWTVSGPVVLGAIGAGFGAVCGVLAGFGMGVCEDAKSLIKLIRKK